MSLKSIQDDMEQSDGATCILGILFHEKDILGHLLGLEVGLLLMRVLSLYGSAFIKEEDTEDWFGDHVEGPFFGGEHFLEGEEVGFEAHFLHEGVDDFGVGFEREPVLVVFLLHLVIEGI
jgi:hypothetical protein